MNHLIGMNKDTTPIKMQEGEWVDAQNVVMTNNRQSLSNEESVARYGCTHDGLLIIGIIELPEGYVQFSTTVLSGANLECRIDYIDDTGFCKCIINDAALNFNVVRPIMGVYSINFKNEITITFWEDLTDLSNPPRLMNLSCLPFTVDADCKLDNPFDIVLLRQFPKVNCINMELVGLDYNGGTLRSGVYYISVAYGFPDGSKSNYFFNGNPISITDDGVKTPYDTFDGVASDTVTSQAIKIKLTGLDTRFTEVCIAVTSKIGGVVTTKEIGDIKITNSDLHYVITGNEGVTANTLTTIAPKATFDKVFAGTVHNNRLYYGNVKTLGKPDIQQYVNAANVKWITEKDLDLNTVTNSYKTPNNIYAFKTFRENAVYAFYLIAHMEDGTKWAFPMNNRDADNITIGASTFPENELMSNISEATIDSATPVKVNPNARYYQFFDTTKADGTLGYWENQNETYPDLDCMDIKNISGVVTGTLRNKKVTHFKMPSLTALNTHLGIDSYTTGTVGTDLLWEGNPSGFTNANSGGQIIFDEVTNNFAGIATSLNPPNNTQFTINQDANLRIELRVDLSDIDGEVELRIFVIKADSSTVEYVNEDVNTGILNNINNWLMSEVLNIPVESGDTLVVQPRIRDNGGLLGDEPNINPPSFLKIFNNDLGNNPVNKKILGVQVTDLAIPTDVQEKVICYELGYAERTSVNLNVLDQDMAITSGGKTLRTHPFDSLYTKQVPNVDWIEQHYAFAVGTPASPAINFPMDSRTALNRLRYVTESFYVPQDITEPTNNEHREEHLRIKVDTDFSPYALIDIMSFKENLYLGLFNQKIVSTGLTWNIQGGVSPNIHGGDTFVSLYGKITTQQTNFSDDPFKYVGDTTRYRWLYPVQSIANINLRHSDDAAYYLPANLDFDNTELEDPDVPDEVRQLTNGLLYNGDYSSVNNLFPIIIAKCEEECTDNQTINCLPYRIVRSLVNNRTEYGTNWRSFLLNDFYEMPTDKGEIYTLNSMNRTLIIQMRNSLFLAIDRDVIKADNISIALGQGDIFERTPDEQIGTDGGYIGCVSRWASKVTKLGYVVVDSGVEDRGKIFLYNGKIDEISAKKMRNFFRDNMYIFRSEDNPWRTRGWSLAYDEKFNRLIFCKKNGTVANQRFDNYCISYSPEANDGRGGWVSFHTYNANVLFNNRQGIYSVYNFNLQVNGVFKHNVNNSYCRWYDGLPNIWYVDFIFNRGDGRMKMVKNIEWYLTQYTNDESHSDYESGLTHIMVYTHHQCSGEIPLNYIKSMGDNNHVRKINGIFMFNNFRDIVITKDTRTVQPNGVVNIANLDTNGVWFKKKQFVNTYFFVRATYDNIVNANINLEIMNLTYNNLNR